MLKDTEKLITDIIYAEELVYSQGWSFVSHTHGCFHMFFVRSGSITLKTKGKPEECAAGRAVIVPPGTTHSMDAHRSADANVDELMFSVSDPFISSRLSAIGIADVSAHASQLIADIIPLANSRKPEMRRCGVYMLEYLLTELCLTSEDFDPQLLNAQFIDISAYSELTRSIVIYVDAHFREQCSLIEIADALGYSKTYICTVFKNETGSTINDYLNLLRVSKCTEYLSFVESDIAYICRQCGFNSISHFNRTFKKFIGMTPTGYKQVRALHYNLPDAENSSVNGEDVPVMFGKLKNIARQISAKHPDVFADSED